MAKTPHLLVVDDEPRILRLVRTNLQTEGYTVSCAQDGQEALRLVEQEDPDLVILDVRLRDSLDGYEVCRRLRAFSQVPVIMLTARSQKADKLKGFAAGADDYLTKPFSAQELLARVKAVLRRSLSEPGLTGPPTLHCGELVIHFAQARVTRGQETVNLTPTEHRLLSELAQQVNEIVPHEDLLTRVWGTEYRDELDYLRAYIWYLRQKVEPNPSKPQYIVSRPGLGYMLTCPDGTSETPPRS